MVWQCKKVCGKTNNQQNQPTNIGGGNTTENVSISITLQVSSLLGVVLKVIVHFRCILKFHPRAKYQYTFVSSMLFLQNNFFFALLCKNNLFWIRFISNPVQHWFYELDVVRKDQFQLPCDLLMTFDLFTI